MKQVQAALALSFCATKDVRGRVFGETAPAHQAGWLSLQWWGQGEDVTATPVRDPRATLTKICHGCMDKVTPLPALGKTRGQGLFKWFLRFVLFPPALGPESCWLAGWGRWELNRSRGSGACHPIARKTDSPETGRF